LIIFVTKALFYLSQFTAGHIFVFLNVGGVDLLVSYLEFVDFLVRRIIFVLWSVFIVLVTLLGCLGFIDLVGICGDGLLLRALALLGFLVFIDEGT
jgi:hypothetical protein